jgi:hypothetical protein
MLKIFFLAPQASAQRSGAPQKGKKILTGSIWKTFLEGKLSGVMH